MAFGPDTSGMPPMGASPAAMATPNLGMQADALTKINTAIGILTQAMGGLQPGTEIHKSVLNSIQSLSKVAPASDAVAGLQQTNLRDLGQQAEQDAMLQSIMRQSMAQGAPGGAPTPGGMPAGAAPGMPIG